MKINTHVRATLLKRLYIHRRLVRRSPPEYLISITDKGRYAVQCSIKIRLVKSDPETYWRLYPKSKPKKQKSLSGAEKRRRRRLRLNQSRSI
jgi:hypothetical protein